MTVEPTVETPKWLELARADVGTREIHGPQTNAKIKKWLVALKAWWSDDEAPWCGVALAAWMQQSNQSYPKDYYRALSWLNWGEPSAKPVEGCVVIFARAGGGHVALLEALGEDGRLLCTGGNQGDEVSTDWFDKTRVVGYRVPKSYKGSLLAVVKTENKNSSTNEA
jgi:uncharacterized protein (TIGR02594 family)